MNIAYNWKKKCRTFSDAGKIVSNIESDLCFYYHCLNSAGSMDHYLPLSNVPLILVSILSPTLYMYIERGQTVGGRVQDYQLLWNNTGAWSAGHCSKLGWIMIREKTCDVRSCIKEDIISQILDSLGFQKTWGYTKKLEHTSLFHECSNERMNEHWLNSFTISF